MIGSTGVPSTAALRNAACSVPFSIEGWVEAVDVGPPLPGWIVSPVVSDVGFHARSWPSVLPIALMPLPPGTSRV